MSFHLRRFFLPISLSALVGMAGAAEPLALKAAQISALGIETIVAGQPGGGTGSLLAARVLVPNAQMRVVAAPADGLIEMLAVAPGAMVKRGQVLAHLLSPHTLEMQRDALQAASQANLLGQAAKRDEQLFAEGLIAESRLQASRAAAAQAATQLGERQRGLALSGAENGQLGGKLALTAAIDGVVLEQGVQLGQRVETATMIYRIAKLSPLWLEIQVPVALAATLRPGTPVGIAGSQAAGKLISVGSAVDPASQTVLLRAEVAKGAESLRPGQFIEVEIATPAGPQQRLPASALVREQGHTLAFVQVASDDQGSRFEARPIRVVSQGGDSVVVDGIKAGERVAVKGTSGLKAMLGGVGKP